MKECRVYRECSNHSLIKEGRSVALLLVTIAILIELEGSNISKIAVFKTARK